MMHAYNEVLLDKASDSMGRMLDFSVHSLHFNADVILSLFSASGVAALFERGDTKIICGMSGIELAYEILEKSGVYYERTNPRHTIALSPEYWCGYVLAGLQWMSSAGFSGIISIISADELIESYKKIRTYHLDKLPWNADERARQSALAEASEEFILSSKELFITRKNAARTSSLSKDAPLKKMRIKNGLSQSELAGASGVPLRTIQQYEQRQKDINRARAEYLIMLSSALNCDVRLLLDY